MSRRRRLRRQGSLMLTAGITMVVTAMVGVGAGLVIFDRSAGCSEVYANPGTADPADIERCRTAFPEQLEIAAAGANFVPSGANETMATQLIAAGVEQGSRPPATRDAPLPPDVAEHSEGTDDVLHCNGTFGCFDNSNPDAWPGDSFASECMFEGGTPMPGPCP